MNMNKLLIIGALVAPGLVFADYLQVNQVSMSTVSELPVTLSIQANQTITTGTTTTKNICGTTPGWVFDKSQLYNGGGDCKSNTLTLPTTKAANIKVCKVTFLSKNEKIAKYGKKYQPLSITANGKMVDLEYFLVAVNVTANNYLLVFQKHPDCKKLKAVPNKAKELFGDNLSFQICYGQIN